ncbi:TPA: aldehyde dehydrogenase family protein, partial [Pseudomonas aeruginosa]|nr:aldehyde dehydrogenase family protein [Pseudomonas aeruginosa]HBO1968560.1 aldehyde dehydrogenase family protein [Pseudomonas aeruginosa]HBO2065899.1 aldehyde dehydrogenase family protein [Pseudomonas aeruginosa]HBO2278794.1 aldehyde dehydrogenase family protein [Pseudomonas aeruginosa]
MEKATTNLVGAAYWRDRADSIQLEGRCLIDGKLVEAQSGHTFDCVSPVDGRFLTKVSAGGDADINRAVAAARLAFRDRRWSGQSPVARKRTLQVFAALIRHHRDELALLETLDMGKPITASRSVDVEAVANCFEWYAEAIDKLYEQIAPTAATDLALITREPLGVVGAIVPWNFPM